MYYFQHLNVELFNIYSGTDDNTGMCGVIRISSVVEVQPIWNIQHMLVTCKHAK